MDERSRRDLAVFTIGSVMKLTQLTARQIRYYEEQELIKPDRTKGNRRLFSFNDVDHLLQIKDLLDQGFSIAQIKEQFQSSEEAGPKQDHEQLAKSHELYQLLKKQLDEEQQTMLEGQLAHFYRSTPNHRSKLK